MERLKRNWWVYAAVAIAAIEIAFGVGNLVEDDGGPLGGRIIAAVVFVGGGALALAGASWRRRNRVVGARMIAAGTLPMVAAVSVVWFPPAVAIGLLALLVAVAAVRDATSQPAAEHIDVT